LASLEEREFERLFELLDEDVGEVVRHAPEEEGRGDEREGDELAGGEDRCVLGVERGFGGRAEGGGVHGGQGIWFRR
jgi:hypothetical protein